MYIYLFLHRYYTNTRIRIYLLFRVYKVMHLKVMSLHVSHMICTVKVNILIMVIIIKSCLFRDILSLTIFIILILAKFAL